MSKLNFDSEMKVTEDMLTDVIHIMKKQRLSALTIDELVGYLSALNTGADPSRQNSTFNTPSKPQQDSDNENSFVFQSPELKYPYKVEPQPEEKPVGGSDIPENQKFANKTQAPNSKLPGFFEMARQSISGDMSTPDKFSEYGFQGETNMNESTPRSPATETTNETSDASNPTNPLRKSLFGDHSSSSSNSTDNGGGAWFWGQSQQQTQDNKKNEFPSLFKASESTVPLFHPGVAPEGKSARRTSSGGFETLDPKFNLGASGNTGNNPSSRSKLSRSSTVPAANGNVSSATATASSLFSGLKATLKTSPKMDASSSDPTKSSVPSQFSFTPSEPSVAPSSTTQPDHLNSSHLRNSESAFKVHTLGATDILHSFNEDENSSTPTTGIDTNDAFENTTSTNGVEEMSIDEEGEPKSPFVVPSAAAASDNDKNPSSANTTTGASTTTFTFPEPDKNMTDAFKGLNLDEDTISFNLGSASNLNGTQTATGSRTAKKSAIKRHQSAKKSAKPTEATSDNRERASDIPNSENIDKEFGFSTSASYDFSSNPYTPYRSKNGKNGEMDETESSYQRKENLNNRFEAAGMNSEGVSNGPTSTKKTPRTSRRLSKKDQSQQPPVSELKSPKGSRDFTGDEPPTWWEFSRGISQDNSDDEDANIKAESAESPRREPSGNPSRPTTASKSKSMSQDSTDTAHSDKTLLHLAEEYSRQGKELYADGQYERSLEAYEKCLKFAPKNWLARGTILGNRAAVQFMLGRYIECVNDCDDALVSDSSLIKLFIRKGKSLIKLGHITNAEDAFQRILTSSFSSNGNVDATLLESVKLEAKAGLRELEKLNKAVDQLIHVEGKSEWSEVMKMADMILKVSPHHRMSQIAKANAFIQLNRHDEAKDFIERTTYSTYMTIAALYAHKGAIFPLPPSLRHLLEWKESTTVTGGIECHTATIINFFLCLGYELSNLYLQCLKNLSLNRYASAEMMNKIKYILQEIDTNHLSIQDKDEYGWSFITKELSKLQELISLKQSADQLFKNKNFHHALVNYTNALKIDKDARIWNAILYSNRAATEMSLGLYAEAVNDCHNAIAKDSEYSRAYLRRARAFRAMNKFNDAVRDYRRYLCFDPIPNDFKDIQKELDEMIDLKAKEEKDYYQQQHPSSSSYRNASNGTSSNSNNNTANNGGRPQSAKYTHSNSQKSNESTRNKRHSTNEYEPFNNTNYYTEYEEFDIPDLKVSPYYLDSLCVFYLILFPLLV